MNTKRTIQKVLLTSLWIAMGAGILFLLVAAIGKKNKQRCSDYVINMKGNQGIFFVDKQDVLKLLNAATGGKIKGEQMKSFNLMRLEQLLEDNAWIKDAELYFDSQDVLHISIAEREPVARIFTTAGSSFYIDSSSFRMPLSDKLSARVPVFTNFPARGVVTRKDSLLLASVRQMALFILNDPFWMAQVAQVDITPQRDFEMITTIGNHLVRFGNGQNVQDKFNRLFVFYKQVLRKAGFDKYSVIDVQYAGQVVGTKRGTATAVVDSVQLRKNVQKLLERIKQLQEEAEAGNKVESEDPVIKTDSAKTKSTETRLDKKAMSPVVKKSSNSNPKKTLQTNIKKNKTKSFQDPMPKAVMKPLKG